MILAARKASQVLLHMGVAFGVMYAFTGSLAFGGLAAVVEPVCNVLLLPLHDRLWQRWQRGYARRDADRYLERQRYPRAPGAILRVAGARSAGCRLPAGA